MRDFCDAKPCAGDGLPQNFAAGIASRRRRAPGRRRAANAPAMRSVERAELGPDVLDLGDVVLAGLDLDVEAEIGGGQVAGRGDHGERGDRRGWRWPGSGLPDGDQFRLGVEHVERRRLPDVALLHDAFERQLAGRHGRVGRVDLRRRRSAACSRR